MTEQMCERCGGRVHPERLAEGKTLCVGCQRWMDQHRPRPGIDDLRDQRAGLPEALRRPEQLWDGD